MLCVYVDQILCLFTLFLEELHNFQFVLQAKEWQATHNLNKEYKNREMIWNRKIDKIIFRREKTNITRTIFRKLLRKKVLKTLIYAYVHVYINIISDWGDIPRLTSGGGLLLLLGIIFKQWNWYLLSAYNICHY